MGPSEFRCLRFGVWSIWGKKVVGFLIIGVHAGPGLQGSGYWVSDLILAQESDYTFRVAQNTDLQAARTGKCAFVGFTR